ncbi:AraC family transcriptional regulator [Chitinimonas sp. PSY-7]|uniref:helix-turn-helix domain-containing protein n=1 Tax=Chitinimonas sp. PSY-7 TaxID=3459088 RepID=UPI00403FD493
MPRYLSTTAPNPDTLPVPLAGFAIDTPAPHDSGLHCHQRAQLLYAVSGVLQIQVNNLCCVLPPHMAAWIPAGSSHQALATKPFAYRSLYFDPAAFTSLPAKAQILAVDPLLRELIVRIAEWPLAPADPCQQRLIEVLLDEIRNAPVAPLSLPLPEDRRLLRITGLLMDEPGNPATLDQLATQAGASSRTINRLFQNQTGLSFSAWRQQLKIMAARRYLAEGMSITAAALNLGYAQESAFIAMFRKVTGKTPGQFKQSGLDDLTSQP